MNNSRIAQFPNRIDKVLTRLYSRLQDQELNDALNIPFDSYMKLYREDCPLSNKNIEAEFWDCLFGYIFSAEGIVDFLAEVRFQLLGQPKNEASYIREHNKIKYPLIDDLPFLVLHINKLAEKHSFPVSEEWLETVNFITSYCRFKPYEMSTEDIPTLATQKKIFGRFLP